MALWSLVDFSPLRTFVFSRPVSHVMCLDPPNAFVAALGEALELVPLQEEFLPPLADQAAMDAAQQLLTKEAVAATAKRKARERSSQQVRARPAANFPGSFL